MLGPYAALLRLPGAPRLVCTSLLARLSFGFFDLAAVILVQRETGSFALAGLVLGAHAVGIGITAPLRGRALDRFGARRVVTPLALAHAGGVAALPLSAGLGMDWLLVLLGFVSGACVPPLVPAMRLEWQRMLGRDASALATAYAFETSAQISVFLVGSLVTGLALATTGPEIPLFASAALVLIAGPAFAAEARAAPSPVEDRAQGLGSILVGGVQTLVLVTVLADAALGIADVAVIAYAVERGQPAAAGVLLALFTAGAVAGGIAYGAHAWRQPAARRLVPVLVVFAAALAALALPVPLPIFAALVLLAGVPSAAQWATTSIVLDDVTPRGQGAEAYTWLSSANAIGVGIGGVVAGLVIDARGAGAGFLVGAALAAAAAATLLTRAASLRPVAGRFERDG